MANVLFSNHHKSFVVEIDYRFRNTVVTLSGLSKRVVVINVKENRNCSCDYGMN